MESIILIAAIAVMAFMWFIQNHCVFCKRMITFQDYMGNGRIRYRKKGTQFPVCRCCGQNHPGEVE